MSDFGTELSSANARLGLENKQKSSDQGIEHVGEVASDSTEDQANGLDFSGENNEERGKDEQNTAHNGEVADAIGVMVEEHDEEEDGGELLDAYHSPQASRSVEDVSQQVSDSLKEELTHKEDHQKAEESPDRDQSHEQIHDETYSATQSHDHPNDSLEEIPLPPLPPKLPPRQNTSAPPPLPPRKRTPFFWLRGKSHSFSGYLDTKGGKRSSADYNLLLQRLDVKDRDLQSRNASEKDALINGIKELQSHFEQVRLESVPRDSKIDWEFWTLVVTDYANVARNRPKELTQAICRGFPSELRGLIWQLIASSKSATLEEVFESICKESSPHEKAIKRDLTRTSFVKNASSDSLFRIIKAYSLFDPEVGYTQGMAFIAVPLLLNMTEPEAFSLLVSLMKYYELRRFFLSDMPGLHLRLYQFDRLLEDTLPNVHVHLSRQGVRSSMYASQWFLTLFAYKFPLQIVLRIFDIVIAEGSEAILKFGVALMKRNADTIMSLEFDSVLVFLKEKIFDYYNDNSGENGSPSGEQQYRVNELVADAFDVKILPLTLTKYENEYTEIHRLERERVEEVESLRSGNGQLTLQVRRLEASLATLNKEHIEVANEMVQGRLEVARLQDENEQLQNDLQEYRKLTEIDGETVDIVAVLKENAELKETKDRLETQLTNLERELIDSKVEFENVSYLKDCKRLCSLLTSWRTAIRI